MKERGPPPLCKCGCSKPVRWNRYTKRWNTYLSGHNSRSPEGRKRWSKNCRMRWSDPVKRFWQRVDRSSGPSACWFWTGRRIGGYGTVKFRNKQQGVHRVVWQLLTGKEIPRGMHVCHHCDVRSCCNPKHLFLGTNRDNMRDRNLKGRQAKGEKVGSSKLQPDQVREIRQLYKAKGITISRLSEQFAISTGAIDAVIHNRTWKHIK